MKQNRLVVISVAVTVVLGATALAFVLLARKNDPKHYQDAIATVLAIEQLAADWNVEATRVRADPLADFDALAAFIPRKDRLRNALLADLRDSPDFSGRLAGDVRDYLGALDAREQFVERFKTGYAVVRNSARYLPLAAAAVVRMPNVDPDLSRDVLDLTEMVEDYLEAPTAVAKDRVEVALRSLQERATELPSALAERVVNFVVHVVVLLNHRAPTDEIFLQATSGEIARLSERLDRGLQALVTRKQEVAAVYRGGSLAVGGTLLGLWIALGIAWNYRFRERQRQTTDVPDVTEAPMKMFMSHRITAQVVAQSLAEAARTISENADSLTVVRHYARSEGALRAKAIANIRTGAREISVMAERLVSFAKDRDDTDYSVVDINECVAEAIGATHAETVVSVTFKPGDVVPVFAARPDICLMLQNVVENSLQAIRDTNKAGEIVISTAGDGNRTVIKVIDNGVGMTPTVRERMYQPFYGAKGTRPGIGLTTTNYLVAKYGGAMSVNSVPAAGTAVRIVLPGMARKADQSNGKSIKPDSDMAGA